MTLTQETARPADATPITEGRPSFNAHSLDLLIAQINAAPELLDRDWRQLVRTAFRLSAEQARSLVEVTPNRMHQIQTYLEQAAEYIRQGGEIRGKIVKRPVEEQTPAAVHEVHIELLESPTPAPPLRTLPIPRMLRIAHCDADCENWEWNSF